MGWCFFFVMVEIVFIFFKIVNCFFDYVMVVVFFDIKELMGWWNNFFIYINVFCFVKGSRFFVEYDDFMVKWNKIV